MPPKALKSLYTHIRCGFRQSGARNCLLCTSEDRETIAQSRCLGLTRTDIYIYTNMKRQHNAITCLTLQLGSKYNNIDHFTNDPTIRVFFDVLAKSASASTRNTISLERNILKMYRKYPPLNLVWYGLQLTSTSSFAAVHWQMQINGE